MTIRTHIKEERGRDSFIRLIRQNINDIDLATESHVAER